MKPYIYIIMCSVMITSVKSKAQTRTGFFMDKYVMAHEINPALQPDSNYMSLPLLGNTGIGMQSTISMGDILFEQADGTLTTFMSKGTISKQDLMDKIGNGVKTNAGAQLTLLSIGRRINQQRYITANLSLKTQAKTWVPEGLFDCMKDIENRDYTIGDVRGQASAYAELAVGESRRMNKKLAIGAKAKLLIGFMNADIKAEGLHLNTKDEKTWTATGKAETNISGLTYKTEEKRYDSRPGSYKQVKGVNTDGFKPCGFGVAADLGMTYKLDSRLTLSAAITDLGIMAWTGSRKAKNAEESFTFNGFQDVEVEKSEENSLKNQWDSMHDDLMDLAHLEENGKHTHTQMLGATLTAAAEYVLTEKSEMKLGAMITHRLDGKFSWTEARVNGTYSPTRLPLSIAISPAISTFGFSAGLMATVSPSKTITIFIGSDHIFFKVNPQMIPTGLNGGVMLGMTINI